MANNNESYIIRIHYTELYAYSIKLRNDITVPMRSLNGQELIDDLTSNGLEILKSRYSPFGGCFFMEVKGEYHGRIRLNILATKSEDFDWHV